MRLVAVEQGFYRASMLDSDYIAGDDVEADDVAGLERLKGARTVVAGGAGFVGSALVRILERAGAKVLVLDNLVHGRRSHLPMECDRVEFRQTDLTDLDAVRAAFDRFHPEYVFNCAGDTYVPSAYAFPGRFLDNNAKVCLNLLDAAKKLPLARFVHASTTEVYGEAPGIGPIDESAPLAPLNTYAVTKLAADRLCSTMADEHDLKVTIARLFNCYGPRETHPYIIPEIFRQLREGPLLTLGALEPVRDFTWVYDTARALALLAVTSDANGEVFNVGSGYGLSVRRLAALCAEVVGCNDLEFEHDRQRERRREISSFVCNPKKIQSVTGWKPGVSLEEGLRRTWAWYGDHGFLWSWQKRSSDVATHSPSERSSLVLEQS